MTAFLLIYLLNALWQVPVLYLAAEALTRLVQPAGPAFQHRIWVAALALEVILPASSFSPLALVRAVIHWLRLAAQPSTASRVTTLSGEGAFRGALALPSPVLLTLAALYLAVILYSAALYLWSLRTVRSLRHSALPLTLAPSDQAQRDHLRNQLHAPETALAVSPTLQGPVAIGLRRPLMLLPLDFHASLTEEDRAAALAHEFAHIARRDFAKNLLYQAIAFPIAWHPALRRTLAHLAVTREILCDRLAAQAVEGPRRYARSLLRLAAVFTPSNSTPHAIGIFDANPSTLETRIMTLTTPRRSLIRISRILLGAVSAAVLLAAFTSAMAFRMKITAPTAAPTADPPARKVSARVMEGNIIKKVNPVYPPEAKETKITGAVVLQAVIGTGGTIEHLTVVSGPKELQPSALEAVRQWLYKPYLLNGQPTEVETTITINYSLSN